VGRSLSQCAGREVKPPNRDNQGIDQGAPMPADPLPARNPPAERIARIIEASHHEAAKWLKDAATGDVWFWPAEQSTHAEMAKALGVADYTKGIATRDD